MNTRRLAQIAIGVAMSLAAGSAMAGSAADQLAQGLDLLKQGQPIQARSALSAALFSGELDKAQEAQAAKALGQLSRDTIFSSKVYDGDPVAYSYTMKPGDTIASVQRKMGGGVPADLIAKINGVDAEAVKPGMTLKFIRGPICGVVTKHSFALDLYLPCNGEKVFVRRAKVAIGKNDGTPEGLFRVAGKAEKATWNPPASMSKKYKKPVEWGQKGYPLGKDGYFISLRGAEESTRGVKGYGIHGTNSQWSIGRAASHGCIRVGDADIGQVWSLLTAGSSTIQIVH